MKRIATCLCALIIVASTASIASAQSMRDRIAGIFSEALDIGLGGSPGAHGGHFSPDNVASSQRMIDALGNFIGTNTSNFSFSSTAAGATFDLSTGVPVRTKQSLGPILGERAETLGKGHINVGWNFSYLSQNLIRGIAFEDIAFTFTHEDVGLPGLGDSDNELDTIDLSMNMKINTSLIVFFTSLGVTDKIDVGIAIPIINMDLEASPYSVVNSFTLLANDSANHFYDGTRSDPILTQEGTRIKEDAVGIGDILIRTKYHFLHRKSWDMGAMIDLRPATGDAEDFLGSGAFSARGALIVSGSLGEFSPHANLAYNLKTGSTQNDYLELFLGFDQKITDNLTFASDILGKYQIGKLDDSLMFPQSAFISRSAGDGTWSRDVQLTNIPDATHDHIVDMGVGVRYLAGDTVMLVGNVLFPLNRDGLRSNIIPTIGIEFNL